MRCLVLGATGYVGGRLVPRLVEAGHEVRCLVRNPDRAAELNRLDGVDAMLGDALDPNSVQAAVEGMDVVFHLVHSLSRSDFGDVDRAAAENVALAAVGRAGRIIYLGGLRPPGSAVAPVGSVSPVGSDSRLGSDSHVGSDSRVGSLRTVSGNGLSRHLASRAEVGDVFLAGPVPAVVLQTSVIVGSGSASFEMLRFLAERLPVLPGIRGLDNETQPAAIADVLHYLMASMDLPEGTNRTVDLGGPEVISYRDLVGRYARIMGQPTPIWLPAPPLPSGLSALAVSGLTPVSAAVAEPLIESLAHPMVCAPGEPQDVLPDPPGGRLDVEEAIRRAVVTPSREPVPAPVRDDPALPARHDPKGSGGPEFVEERRLPTSAGPDQLWRVIESIGGDNGWYTVPYAWQLRGVLDRALGGVGDYRGRRDPKALRRGEILDWWRVEEIEPGKRLVLRAEMRMPGTAWLEMSVGEAADGRSEYRQRVTFRPAGPAGHLYWWGQRLGHEVVFGVMAKRLVRAAEKLTV